MSVDPKLVQELFLRLIELPATDQPAALDRECAGDEELRQRVTELLRAHREPDSYLDQPLGPPGAGNLGTAPNVGRGGSGPAGVDPTQENTPGTFGPSDSDLPRSFTADYGGVADAGVVIAGRYSLHEKIGEGGMGEVWVAKQTEPVKRKVALKLIKAGMDSRSVLRRFEQERQALAVMDHPNIARVLDGGLTSTRRPFFVMELVNGLPLTRFCDDLKLTPRQRLELFVPICQAVQHAHQKGIVHRDLKPANILVTMVDGRPVPKVIDFGVAKATSSRLTEESMSTGFGAVVGTLEYMSPEQAGFSSDDIDTRADIYSLGVILYELLTGLRPIDSKRLKQAAFTEMVRIVREEEPSRPSTRLSTDQSLPSLAAMRAIEPRKLMALLRGDLDWVVMKCIEKQRDRRYETANALTRDIQRYLNGDAVEACPPSLSYRLSKFIKRHKGQVIAASLVLLALVGGVVGTSIGLLKANAAARAEAVAKADALEKAAAEKAARLDEERERKYAQAIADFVKYDFLALTSVEGQTRFEGQGLDRNSTLLDLLNRAADKLEKRKDLDPRIEAELCWIIGVNYRGVGEAGKAVPFLERAVELRRRVLGPDHLDTFSSINSLGVAYSQAARTKEAIALFEQLRDAQVKQLGPDHPDTLGTLTLLAGDYKRIGKSQQALEILEQVRDVAEKQLVPDHEVRPETIISILNELAAGYLDVEKSELAIPLFERAHAAAVKQYDPDNPFTLSILHNLAVAYHHVGQTQKAIALLEQVRDATEKQLGPDHPNTLAAMHSLAREYWKEGKLPEAIALFEQIRDVQLKKPGPDHPDTLFTLTNLAENYRNAKRLPEAIALLEEVRDAQLKQLGLDHPDSLYTLQSLGMAYRDAKRLPEAIALFERVREFQWKQPGPDHPDTLKNLNNLAMAYLDAEKTPEALEVLQQVRDTRLKLFGPDHPESLVVLKNLTAALRIMNNRAAACMASGQTQEAIALLEQVLAGNEKHLGLDHPNTLKTLGTLAKAYWLTKQLDKSVPLLEKLLERREKRLGRDHPETLRTIANLGVNYRDAGRHREAIPLLEEAYGASRQHSSLRWVGPALLEAYDRAGESSKFGSLLQEQLTEARQSVPKDSPQLASLLAVYSQVLLQWKQWVEVEPLLRECLAIRQEQDPDSWSTFNARSMLGEALLGQKKYAEAERLLLEGYEGMKAREETIPSPAMDRLPEALDRLIELYTADDQPDEVKRWQAERAKYPSAEPTPQPATESKSE